jgi:hypothetical protein
MERAYEVPLTDLCLEDHGTQILRVTATKVTICCNGPSCRARGKRWDRPSHTNVKWDLCFLFPDHLPTAVDVPHPPESGEGGRQGGFMEAEADAFFARAKTFLVALGFEGPGVCVAPRRDMYKARLDQLKSYAVSSAASARARASSTLERWKSCARWPRWSVSCARPGWKPCLFGSACAWAPDFAYPVELQPRAPWVSGGGAAFSTWPASEASSASRDTYYVPHTDEEGTRVLQGHEG